MGAKLYADSANKRLVITQVPDGDGFIDLNVQVDVWSDLIEDWESDLTLRGHTFPIVLIGAATVSAGKLGSTYVLLSPWQISPYEADHDFNIDGNLFTESALTKLVLPTVGDYTVTVTRNLSTLVEVVETGTSGLTPQESQDLADTKTAAEAAQVDNRIALYGKKITRKSTDPLTLPGTFEIYDPDTGLLVGTADAYEDEDGTVGYRGRGIDRQDAVS